MSFNLLEKTELWINNIALKNANLSELARTVADVLGIDGKKVLVVDVRENHITLDILEKDIPAENIIGKEREIKDRISKLDGVCITDETYIHSNGILGMISFEEENPSEHLSKVNIMVNEIKARIAKRAIIFPTGFELKTGLSRTQTLHI